MNVTYFARHTQALDIDDSTRKELWVNQRIAIHFPHTKDNGQSDRDSESLDPNDYEGSARKAIRALRSLSENGGYVCAQYYGYEESLVGVVRANSPIELLRGKWGNLYGLAGRIAVLKTLQLRRVKQIAPMECPVILVGRPRQGTLMRWPKAGLVIANLVEDKACEAALCDLMPAQQEIICSEFLRLPEAEQLGLPTLAHLILPIGRTMKDVDIYGLAKDGKRILAQVTFSSYESSEATWKLDRLKQLNDSCRSHLILFCNTEADRIAVKDDIKIVPINTVFSRFRNSDDGSRWLSLAVSPRYVANCRSPASPRPGTM